MGLGLLIGLLIASDYGVSIDEPRNADIGSDALKAYAGASDYFLHDTLAEHGPVYFMFFYASSKALARVFTGWLIPDGRHFTNYFTFLLGVYFFYLICLRLVRRLPAMVTTALFATQPLLFGSAFINQKDIPFMVFFLGVIASGLAAGDYMEPAQTSAASSAASSRMRLAEFSGRIGRDWRNLENRKRKALVVGSVLGLFLLLDLFLVGTLHRLGLTIVVAAFNGQAPGPIQTLFSRIVPDVSMASLQLFLGRYNTLFSVLRTLMAGLLVTSAFIAYSTTLPSLGQALKGNWPNNRYPPLLLGAILLGCATSVRQVGLFAGGLVSLYLLYRGRQKAVFPLILYWAIAVLVTFGTWPYLWSDPIHNLMSSFTVIPGFGNHDVLFRGQIFPSEALPWQYFPTLVGLQLTEPSLALIALGLCMALWSFVRVRPGRVLVAMVTVWAGTPIFWLIFNGIPIYNSIRHLLFVLPPLFILACFGVEAVLTLLRRPVLTVLIVTLILAPGVWGIVQLHPYEYGYFNSLTGGVSGAFGNYEIDYWCTSVKEATEFIDRAADDGDVLRVLGPVQNALPYARDDLANNGFRGSIASADWVLVCPPNWQHPWDSSDFQLVYQVARGRAVLTEVWQKQKPPSPG